jgi:hypothetical protein
MKPKGTGLNVPKVRPLDDIRKDIMAEFSTIEVEILTAIEFDLEFDLPVKYFKNFKLQYLDPLFKLMAGDKAKNKANYLAVDQIIGGLRDLTLKLVRDQYLRPFCLYFPAPIIFAACLLLANLYTN